MDGLTGFLDRNECLHALTTSIADAQASAPALAVLWVGIDRFRQINASFGHRAGDNVLAQLAYRLRSRAKVGDRLARIGGDEFVVLLPDSHPSLSTAAAERILSVLSEPLEIGDVRIRPSASVGIALAQAGEAPESLLERADRAMVIAKELGGSQYVNSGDERQAGRSGNLLAREELAIEEQLHEALEMGGLSLNYQPILNTRDGGIEALEALMRCNVRGQAISPAHFIPVAEKTGLIVRLGEWTLLTAARLVDRLALEGRQVKVAVNVSRAQLTAPKFKQTLYAVLACSDVSPASLELELTESLFMDMSTVVRNNLDAALEAGFPLAIDDFGTGYSCLAYLKDLPARKLKLDRAFIVGLPEDKKSFAIVRTVTQLARDLGMTVVAEGVETQAQYDSLCAAGVDAIQGFLLCRPLTEPALDTWLQGRQG
ncbi:MAG: EAL domain-containing protein [Azonexus sp.]|nr:EAL domain-containing protein [Azonexus sp.]